MIITSINVLAVRQACYINGNNKQDSICYLSVVKAITPINEFTHWRSEQFLNIDLASYTLFHHSFPRHFHDRYVIELVVKGVDKFYCSGKTYTAKYNELVFINPGEVHTGSTIFDTALHYYSVTPDKKNLQQIAELLERPLPEDFYFQNTLVTQPELVKKILLPFTTLQLPSTDTLKNEELFFELMNELLCNGSSEPNFAHT